MSSDARSKGRAAVPLLARVRSPETALAAGGAAAEHALRQSILAHLQAMCATRLGSMPIRPDYGLPDLSEMVHSFPDAIDAMARALVHTIQTYEPRLTDVRVHHVPSEGAELVVRFEVSAMIRGAGGRTPVRFETRIDSSRRVSVK
jgi:type VI secretion system protein